MTAALLEADSLCAERGDKQALANVSISVCEGELWTVLGPNGAGKSTLLHVLLGLLPPTHGEVKLGDRPLREWPARARAAQLAWVPQSFDASLGFSGLELVLMGRSPYLGLWGLPREKDERKAREVMEELGLGHLAHRSTATLSGGELRLLLVARALVQSPKVLVLDEPTAFLDLRHQVQTLEAVRRRVGSGMGAIAVLHDVNLAACYSDKVLLLRRGEVLASGSPRDTLTSERLEALYGLPVRAIPDASGAAVFLPQVGR